MFHIRTTTTTSGSTAVQIIRYQKRKIVVVKHVGSARENNELKRLKETASIWIEKASKQPSLFPDEVNSPILQLNQFRYLGFSYDLLYDSLYQLCKKFKFHWLRNKLLVDLIIARIVEPCSKLQSIEFLKEFMGKEHHRRSLYREMPRIQGARNTVERKVLEIARKEFAFDFSLVFYDVTTLYFESFESDDLRQCGFSKDNKFNQPQIILGLLVNSEGFPFGYQIFNGKKFEGHTLIPVIMRFKRKQKIEKFTVVADAAMISNENIEALLKVGLQYIVGARVSNLSLKLIETISSKLGQNDGATIRIQTKNGGLVCNFSAKRYSKDKLEMEKQISKAEKLLKNPGSIKRTKFISSEEQVYVLNRSLIE